VFFQTFDNDFNEFGVTPPVPAATGLLWAWRPRPTW